MDTLGLWLRQAREAQGSTLQEVETETHIRKRFLEALEAGDFAVFPGGEVQIRGFLRIYARYLGLSVDEVLTRYDAEVRGVEAVTRPDRAVRTPMAPPVRPTPGPAAPQPPSIPISASRPPRTGLERLMIVGVVLIALLAVVTGVGYLASRNALRPAATTVTVTVPSETRLPSSIMTPSALPTAMPALPADAQGEAVVRLEATEHVWVRVTKDNQLVFEGLMAPGQVEAWSAQERVVVETGNGAGLLVTVNEQPQGTMCGRAEVCTRAWGPAGEITLP